MIRFALLAALVSACSGQGFSATQTDSGGESGLTEQGGGSSVAGSKATVADEGGAFGGASGAASVRADAGAAGTAASGQVGDVCHVDSDCDSSLGLGCVTKDGVGSCQVPKVVPPGTDCSMPDAACPDGYFCDGSSKSSTRRCSLTTSRLS